MKHPIIIRGHAYLRVPVVHLIHWTGEKYTSRDPEHGEYIPNFCTECQHEMEMAARSFSVDQPAWERSTMLLGVGEYTLCDCGKIVGQGPLGPKPFNPYLDRVPRTLEV